MSERSCASSPAMGNTDDSLCRSRRMLRRSTGWPSPRETRPDEDVRAGAANMRRVPSHVGLISSRSRQNPIPAASLRAMTPAILPTDPAASLLTDVGFELVDQTRLPARTPRFAAVPERLHPRVREVLARRYPKGLYLHQARAIDALLDGGDVCVATPTASGKTLSFVAYAAHTLLEAGAKRPAKVVALYPARALIQDQLEVWRDFLRDLDLRVAIVDGGVPVAERAGVVGAADVILMTPDVAHAWLLGRVRDRAPRAVLAALRLLVLDEAHTYAGAFGTNMAHFLRRLAAIAAKHPVVTSTATLSDASTFVEALTGRAATCIGVEDDGSEAPTKRLLIVRRTGDAAGKGFEANAALVKRLASGELGRFLVFGDSRKLVETTVAALRRDRDVGDAGEGVPDHETDGELELQRVDARVLPYRAGYEEHDRREIQRALSEGRLAGVVATSALELGIDIGAIECVLLLSPPPSMKSFWQRFGRAGRRSTPGTCILVDDDAVIERAGGVDAWLERPIEPSRLYVENRYIQYAQALCAAAEITDVGRANVDFDAFATLPAEFRAHLENELDPKRAVPQDLYALKQRAQAQPHFEFPIRFATEKNFKIKTRGSDDGKGVVTHAQMLREAYPGAIYYYMADAYRIVRVDERRGEIECRRDRAITTRPNAQTMVFPRFANGALQLARGANGFVCEAELQVSERVLGFTEVRGGQRYDNPYGPMSTYSQRPVTRFFETSGVCWWTSEGAAASERAAAWIRAAFCHRFGIQEQDVGVGLFHAQPGPAGHEGVVKGACVYDATNGSLRLTSILATHFVAVVEAAIAAAYQAEEDADARELERLRDAAIRFARVDVEPVAVDAVTQATDGLVDVVAPGEVAMYLGGAGPEEITVVGVLYTAVGVLYEVEPPTRDSKRKVASAHVVPLAGRTKMARFDTRTLEIVRED